MRIQKEIFFQILLAFLVRAENAKAIGPKKELNIIREQKFVNIRY
jgi:hypothetical protein